MPDLSITTRIGWWDAEETLKRARRAADAMGLPISDERADGFKAGSQWTRPYELEVWVEGRWNGSDLTIHGRTMKVGFNTRLDAATRRFVDLVRNPGHAAQTVIPAPAANGPGALPDLEWDDYLNDWDVPDEQMTQTLPFIPVAAAGAQIFYGVVGSLIATGILAGGKYVISKVEDGDGNETDERPAQLYDPDTKQVWHRQSDGSYLPSGQRID